MHLEKLTKRKNPLTFLAAKETIALALIAAQEQLERYETGLHNNKYHTAGVDTYSLITQQKRIIGELRGML